MRPVAAAAVLLSASLGASQRPAADCDFTVRSAGLVAVTPTGPREVVSRVRILPQPDSPIVITKADFGGSRLEVVPGSFEWKPSVRLELLNVSDRGIKSVRAAVHVRARDSSGVGDGARWDTTLAPGARAELVVRGGTGWGVFAGDDVSVDVFVEAVTFEGCIYRPSQAIRTAVTGFP